MEQACGAAELPREGGCTRRMMLWSSVHGSVPKRLRCLDVHGCALTAAFWMPVSAVLQSDSGGGLRKQRDASAPRRGASARSLGRADGSRLGCRAQHLAHPGLREPVLGLIIAISGVVVLGRGCRFSVQAMRKICSTMSATSQRTGRKTTVGRLVAHSGRPGQIKSALSPPDNAADARPSRPVVVVVKFSPHGI